MGDFRKPKVFEKAHRIAVRVHQVARAMRDSRYLSLRNQMIRSAESIPTNIVEAARQLSNRDFARFLHYSLNSASELEYQLMLARDIAAAPEAETNALVSEVVEVRKMLHGLIRRVTGGSRDTTRQRAKPGGADSPSGHSEEHVTRDAPT
jgi:four helix bundle protein